MTAKDTEKMDNFTRLDSHTISLLVANKPGVLLRISLVFSRRGFNVESLVVSPARDGRFSRMTVTARGDHSALDQIVKQCAKLVDVVNVQEHQDQSAVEKELALVKVAVSVDRRNALLLIIDHFKASTVDFSHDSAIIQVTGSSEKLDAMMEMLSEFELVEVVRTGKVVMARGRDAT